MSILKSNNGNPDACNRYTFAYENPVAGEGHFIHTYMHDGNPLPSFEGEPKLVGIPNDIDAFTKEVWEGLNEDNKMCIRDRYGVSQADLIFEIPVEGDATRFMALYGDYTKVCLLYTSRCV